MINLTSNPTIATLRCRQHEMYISVMHSVIETKYNRIYRIYSIFFLHFGRACWDNMYQPKTPAPLCQTFKHYMRCSAGLVLGPVLFLLYIHDMHRSSDQMRFVHFAHYTTVFASSDINNVHASVNRELVEVDNWLKTNRLSLNVSKTSYMIISNQEKTQ